MRSRFTDEHSEAGFTLVELLVAMVVMGLSFVALLAAMATSTVAAGTHRTQALAELEVRRYAELVEAAGFDEDGYIADKIVPAGDLRTGVGYVPPTTPPFDFKKLDPTMICIDAHGDPAACAGAPAQIVTVTVESVSEKVKEWLEIVKQR